MAELGVTAQPFEIPTTARGPVHPTICECTHRLYTHGRWREPGSGAWIYSGCREPGCPCERYGASDNTGWPPS